MTTEELKKEADNLRNKIESDIIEFMDKFGYYDIDIKANTTISETPLGHKFVSDVDVEVSVKIF